MTRVRPGAVLKTRISGHPNGCMCEMCPTLRRRHSKLIGIEPALVDASEVRALFTAWTEQHYTTSHIGHATGIRKSTVRRIIEGEQQRLTRHLAQRALSTHMTPASAPHPTSQVPAIGATRRLQALRAIGYPRTDLQPLMPNINISLLASGRPDTISRANWERVREVYDDLSMTPGPSDISRRRARRAGFAPPLAWDDEDIDNPEARPADGYRRRWG